MPKSPDAFRTISEVADWLGIQAHVLRFWESKFSQVKPIKRAGGRRYYRPGDMLLLGGIRQLLHEDGLTIKGVQKILREEGMSHVAALSQPLDELTQSQLDESTLTQHEPASIDVPEAVQETGVVLNFDSRPTSEKDPDAPAAQETEQGDAADSEASPIEASEAEAPEEDVPAPAAPEPQEELATAPSEVADQPPEQDAAPEVPHVGDDAETQDDAPIEAQADPTPEPEPEPDPTPAPEPESQIGMSTEVEEPSAPNDAPADHDTEDEGPSDRPTALDLEENEQATLQSAPTTTDDVPADDVTTDDVAPDDVTPDDGPSQPAPPPEAEDATPEDADHKPAAASLPAFLRRPMTEPEPPSDNAPAPAEPAEPEPMAPTPPKPRDIGMPDVTPYEQIDAHPAALTQVFRTRSLTTAQAKQIAPLLDKLTILRDSMAARRRGASNPGPND